MLKVLILTRRRDGLSRAEFERYLRETHLPLVARMPGLRKLAVHWTLADPDGPPPAWDAIGEDWFDDPAAFGAALASEAGQAVIADAPNCTDTAASQFLLIAATEGVLLPAGCATVGA